MDVLVNNRSNKTNIVYTTRANVFRSHLHTPNALILISTNQIAIILGLVVRHNCITGEKLHNHTSSKVGLGSVVPAVNASFRLLLRLSTLLIYISN